MGLPALLTRRLWTESAPARRSRQLRQLVTLPPMIMAGTIWGVLAAGIGPTQTPGGVIAGAAVGAIGFGLGTRLYLQFQPLLVWWAENRFPKAGRWVASAFDSVLAGSAVWLLTRVLGLPTYPSVTAVVTLGGAYAATVAAFFDEGGSRLVGGALGVIRGGGTGHRIPGYSHIQARMAKGDFDDAIRELEAFVEEHPGDTRGWLDLGRLLADHRDDPDDAIRILRTGVDRARMDLRTHRQYVATMLRIRRQRRDEHLIGRDLAFLAEVAGDDPDGDWARRELDELRRASGSADPLP